MVSVMISLNFQPLESPFQYTILVGALWLVGGGGGREGNRKPSFEEDRHASL